MSFDSPLSTSDESFNPAPETESSAVEPASTPPRKSSSRSAKRSTSLRPRDVQQVLETRASLKNLDTDVRSTVAMLFGLSGSSSIDDLTTALLTSKSTSTELARGIVTWHGGSEIDTTLAIYQLSEQRAGLSPLWSLMSSCGFIEGTMPRSSSEATRQLAVAVHSLDGEQIAALESAVALLP